MVDPFHRSLRCKCMKESIDHLMASPATGANAFTRDPPSHMTTGILTIACPEGEVELKIEPSVFLSMVDNPEWSHHPYSTDPDFQPYFVKAWASYQADRTVKEKPHEKWCREPEFPTHAALHDSPSYHAHIHPVTCP
jgi:hypothetical protein